jgi:hypothetical protein
MSQDPQRWISYKALSEVQGRMPLHPIERVCFLNACRRAATAKKKSAYMALDFGLVAILRGTFAVRFDW